MRRNLDYLYKIYITYKHDLEVYIQLCPASVAEVVSVVAFKAKGREFKSILGCTHNAQKLSVSAALFGEINVKYILSIYHSVYNDTIKKPIYTQVSIGFPFLFLFNPTLTGVCALYKVHSSHFVNEPAALRLGMFG